MHRAVWADGREVAVKVQYPAPTRPARRPEDAHPVRRAVHVGDAGNGHQTILDELSARTEEELDYRHRGRQSARVREGVSGDPRFVVPRVVASAPRSFVTEWIRPPPLGDHHDGTTDNATPGRAAPRSSTSSHLRRWGCLQLRSATRALHAARRRPPRDHRLRSDRPDAERVAPGAGPHGPPQPRGALRRADGTVARQWFRLPGRTVTDQEIADYLRPFTDRSAPSRSTSRVRGCRRRPGRRPICRAATPEPRVPSTSRPST
ncbi:hypothetical protein GS426_02825 [Rhodococcus hoagii]|nr:hypothetical protein [Prescottella equi]